MLTATGGMSPMFLIGYIYLFRALMYFMAIRPQQKEKKKQQALLAQRSNRRQCTDNSRILRCNYRHDR